MDTELRIAEVILPETTELELVGIEGGKDALFRTMVSLLYRAGKIRCEDAFLKAVYAREALGSTYMGNHIAIPHGKSDTVVSPTIAFCRSQQGILYETVPEPKYANLIFMLAVPDRTGPDEYIKVLARLARLLIHDEVIKGLYAAKSYSDVIEVLKAGERVLDNLQ
ncbi:PTS sugar transporter subunit IIA [Moorellaceae bacterium AZ2]